MRHQRTKILLRGGVHVGQKWIQEKHWHQVEASYSDAKQEVRTVQRTVKPYENVELKCRVDSQHRLQVRQAKTGSRVLKLFVEQLHGSVHVRRHFRRVPPDFLQPGNGSGQGAGQRHCDEHHGIVQ